MFSKAKLVVLGCEVALDHKGNAHLYQYTPHSDGREGARSSGICSSQFFGIELPVSTNLKKKKGQWSGLLFCSFALIKSQDQILRSCATFAMGAPCRAALRLGSQWQSSNHQQSTCVTWIKIFFRSSLRSNKTLVTLVVLWDTSWNGGPGRKWQAADGTRSSKSVGFQEFNDAAAQPSRFRKIKIWRLMAAGGGELFCIRPIDDQAPQDVLGSVHDFSEPHTLQAW